MDYTGPANRMTNYQCLFRRIVIVIQLAIVIPMCLIPLGGAAAERQQQPKVSSDPIALYGNEIYFDVVRDGKRAGWHHVVFTRNGSELIVTSRFNLQIDFLFFTAFRYFYESEERWLNNQLEGLTVRVNDDGAVLTFQKIRDGKKMIIMRDGEENFTDEPLYPTNHWNADVLTQSRVLNTLTGKTNRVTIRSAGRDTVATERGELMATRYVYSGELVTEVWYDDSNRWVKMRFAGRDGSTIEYICRRCQGGPVTETLNDKP